MYLFGLQGDSPITRGRGELISGILQCVSDTNPGVIGPPPPPNVRLKEILNSYLAKIKMKMTPRLQHFWGGKAYHLSFTISVNSIKRSPIGKCVASTLFLICVPRSYVVSCRLFRVLNDHHSDIFQPFLFHSMFVCLPQPPW